MIVQDILNLLESARHFAVAADISAAAKGKLDATCGALEPFRSMDLSNFTALLQQAEEYKRTGVLPVSAKSRKPATRKPPATAEDVAQRVEHLASQLRELHAIVHDETVGFGAIDEIVEVVGKLNAAEVKQVAAKFEIRLGSKATKPQALEEIKRKLTEQKGSAQRIQPITSA